MPEPVTISLASLLALGKKEGPKAAAAAYRRLAPTDWASRLGKLTFKGQPRPRPRRALVRALRKDGLLELLTAEVVAGATGPRRDLVVAVNRGLRRDPRWDRLSRAQRSERSAALAGRLVTHFIGSLDPADAVSVSYRATQTRFDSVDRRLDQRQGVERDAMHALAADRAEGRLARLRERLDGLPAALRPMVEAAFDHEPEGVGEVIAAVTGGALAPGQAAAAWIRHPPPVLGTASAPTRFAAWVVLGRIALVYGELDAACAAFECAVLAGALPRDRFLAYAAWAACQSGEIPRAEAIVARGDGTVSTEPAMRLVALRCAMLSSGASDPEARPGAQTSTEPSTPNAPQTAEAKADERREHARQLIAEWAPDDPLERDLRARLGADLEITNEQREVTARFDAAVALLQATLAQGWLDEVASALCWSLRARANQGLSTDRAGDLDRAEALALEVRDARRQARGNSRLAVRAAAEAAGLAARPRRVIEIGSDRFGHATAQEAADPDTIRYVVMAAVQCAPEVAADLETRLDELPAGFTRAWAHAMLACRSTREPQLERTEQIQLWEAAFEAAAPGEERRLAAHGLAMAGSANLPMDQLSGELPWVSAEIRARAAVTGGDARTAVTLLLPHRAESPLVALTLADAYMHLDQLDVAIDTLTQAAQRFDHDDLFVEAARIAAAAEQSQRAEGLLTGVLTSAAPNWAGRSRALQLLGELQGNRGAWAEAMSSWTSALELDPFNETVRWYMADCHTVRGAYEPAWQVLTADPRQPGHTRDPPEPPHARYAHMVLILLHRHGDYTTLVRRALDLIERFADDPTFHTAALSVLFAPNAQAAAPEPLDTELAERLSQALAAFRNAYPDDPNLRAITFDSNISPDELVEQMAAQSRPDPQQVHHLKVLSVEVARGAAPLGMIAALASRSYALLIAELAVGVLTAEGDEEEHARSIDDALRSLGIDTGGTSSPTGSGSDSARELLSGAAVPAMTVVIDTTALYARTTLSDLDRTLTDGIRQISLVDDAYTDIVLGRDQLAANQVGTLVVDPDTGQVRIFGIDPDARQRHRDTIAALHTLADACRREIPPSSTHPMLDQLAGQRNTSWMAGVRLAHCQGAALWADDFALRSLARQVGIPAFSTMALLTAHTQLGSVSPEQREDALRTLIRNQIGDFTPDPARLRALVGESSTSRAAVLAAVAKPAFWRALGPASSTFTSLLDEIRSAQPTMVPGLVGNAIIGIARTGLPPEVATELASSVLAVTMNRLGGLADIPAVLDASRAALRQAPAPLPDLLPSAARRLLRAYQATSATAQLAAANLTSLVSRCSPEDQATIRYVILGL